MSNMEKQDHKNYLAARWAEKETGYTGERSEWNEEGKTAFYTEYGRAMWMLRYMESVGATISMCVELDGTELELNGDE
jgi:hypothetical protein